jgi:hypothetical protein
MLELAPSAERHVLLLVHHYRRKHRFEAEYRLIKTLEDATHAVQRSTAKFHPAPPRYPSVAKYGLLWFKEWHYWIAITSGGNPQFVAIIYETANVPRQMARARLKSPP